MNVKPKNTRGVPAPENTGRLHRRRKSATSCVRRNSRKVCDTSSKREHRREGRVGMTEERKGGNVGARAGRGAKRVVEY